MMHDVSWNQVKVLRMIMPLSNHIASHWLMKHIFLSFVRQVISEPIKNCLRNMYKGHSSVTSRLEQKFWSSMQAHRQFWNLVRLIEFFFWVHTCLFNLQLKYSHVQVFQEKKLQCTQILLPTTHMTYKVKTYNLPTFKL